MSDQRARPILAEAIQATAATDDDIDGAVLMGWVVVAEWMAPTGQRWLTRCDGTASGEDCPEWQRDGYLHNALFRSETFDDDDEDDEDDDGGD